MKFSRKKIFAALAALAILAQLIRPSQENPSLDSSLTFNDNSELTEIFKNACYDCHSNETRWPWYSHIAPVSWVISHHVEEGREHLNFSTWNSLSEKKLLKAKDEIWEEVEEGKMPLKGYIWLHKNAKLSKSAMEKIKEWSKATNSN